MKVWSGLLTTGVIVISVRLWKNQNFRALNTEKSDVFYSEISNFGKNQNSPLKMKENRLLRPGWCLDKLARDVA